MDPNATNFDDPQPFLYRYLGNCLQKLTDQLFQ